MSSALPELRALARIPDGAFSDFGAKAVNLGRLARAGLPVPAGFCVPASCYRAHAEAAGLTPLIPHADIREGTAEMLARLRQLIGTTSVAENLTRQVASQLGALGPGRVAVRSSGTAEDLPGASAAGMHDTFFGLPDPNECLRLIRRCWASLWSDRAFEYREKHLLDHSRAAIAVIVQRLVEADTAGVAFTADPTTGSRDRIVIEAVAGLGDKLVSGRAAPHRLVLTRRGLRVSERSGTSLGLSGRLVRGIGRLALKAERLLGAPQDVEWAVAGGRVWLLQSRPITALAGRAWQERQVWTNVNISETLPEPAPPLAVSFAEFFFSGVVKWLLWLSGVSLGDTVVSGQIAGRVYINLNSLVGIVRAIPFLNRMRLSELFGGLRDEQFPQPENVPPVRVNRLKALLLLPGLFIWFLTNQPGRGRRIVDDLRQRTDQLQRLDYAAMSDEELTRQVTRGIAELLDLPRIPGAGAVLTGMMYYSLLFNACRTWFNDRESAIASHLLGSLGSMDSPAAGLDLWRLAQLARASPALGDLVRSGATWAELQPRLAASTAGREFLRGWDELMFRHGHHCRGEFDVSKPRWRDQPDYVLATVRSYLEAGAALNPEADLERRVREREQFTRTTRARLRNPLQRLGFDFLLRRAQAGACARENVRNDSNRRAAIARTVLLELGARRAGKGTLAEPDDIFFLRLDELGPVVGGTQTIDVRRTIARRRAAFEHDCGLSPPPVIVDRFDPSAVRVEPLPDPSGILRGLAVSPGISTGRARVVLQHDAAEHVLPGEILVAPYTDPGWTPYFLPAAGIVVDVGGLLSHGSIVAREFGKPAVVNVGPATRIIRTGQLVQVDGSKGEVRILSA